MKYFLKNYLEISPSSTSVSPFRSPKPQPTTWSTSITSERIFDRFNGSPISENYTKVSFTRFCSLCFPSFIFHPRKKSSLMSACSCLLVAVYLALSPFFNRRARSRFFAAATCFFTRYLISSGLFTRIFNWFGYTANYTPWADCWVIQRVRPYTLT